MSYYEWRPYVPVAEKRRQAERKLAKLKKQGQSVAPVTIEGRTIAKSFWGKSWCTNLERYSDYENRLPRGRTLRPQRLRRRPANHERRDRGDGQRVSDSTRSRSPSHRSRRHAGKPSAGIAPEPSIRWLSFCRAAWPKASWTGSVGRATACFRRRRKSSCPAAVRTGPTCASTLRRRCMASAPGSTKSPSSSLCCAVWTKTNCSPVPDRTFR